MAEPSAVYTDMRKRMLKVVPKEGGMRATPQLPHVYGAVVDIGFDPLFTVVAFADGTTSVYDSRGSVIAGLGEMPEFRAKAYGLLTSVEENLGQLAATATSPLPAFGRVRVTALTYEGRLGVELPGEPLLSGVELLSVVLLTALSIIDKAQTVAKRADAQAPPNPNLVN